MSADEEAFYPRYPLHPRFQILPTKEGVGGKPFVLLRVFRGPHFPPQNRTPFGPQRRIALYPPERMLQGILATMSEPEKIITELETQFPALSGIAFTKAREESLAAGQSVLSSENGVIYEVFPDGRRLERKRIESPTPIPVGTKMAIR